MGAAILKYMHPTVARVLEYLEANGIEKQLFSCQVIKYLPEHKQMIQGTNKARECSRSWKSAQWRILQGKVTPRNSVLQAWEAWLTDQQQQQ